MKGIEPSVQLLATFFNAKAGIVGDVVTLPHKGIHGAQCLALAPRQNQESIIKILRSGSRNAAADGVCHHQLRRSRSPGDGGGRGAGAHRNPPRSLPMAARATRTSFRPFEMEGRRPSTAKF